MEKDWEIKYHFQMSWLNFIVTQKVVEKYLTVRIDGIITCLFQIKRNKLTANEGKLLCTGEFYYIFSSLCKKVLPVHFNFI